MIRVNRPFDRWFDLTDAYGDVALPRGEEKPRAGARPDAHREWTYDAPGAAKSPRRPRPEPGKAPR